MSELKESCVVNLVEEDQDQDVGSAAASESSRVTVEPGSAGKKRGPLSASSGPKEGKALSGSRVVSKDRTSAMLHSGTKRQKSEKVPACAKAAVVEEEEAETARAVREETLGCFSGYDSQAFGALPGELKHRVIESPEQDGKDAREKKDHEVSFLSYNVWFEESVALGSRMRGIVAIVKREQPTILALQEVTVNIVRHIAGPLRDLGYRFVFQKHADAAGSTVPPYFVVMASKYAWDWHREVHYRNSKMGRCVLYGSTTMPSGTKILVGTSHLESAVPPFCGPSMHSLQRKEQLEAALRELDDATVLGTPNLVVLLGDMNWDEGGRPHRRNPKKLTATKDGDMGTILGETWKDIWLTLKKTSHWEEGCTYDGSKNKMLGNALSFRPDRILCRPSANATPTRVALVGTEPLGGVTHTKKGQKVVPVYPSDHFGILASFVTRRTAQRKHAPQ